MAKVVPPLKRLLSKIAVDTVTGCWNWTGGIDNGGYGSFQVNGKIRPAHRHSWLLHGYPEPAPGNVLDHMCCNKICINPSHLQEVASGENIRLGSPIFGARSERGECKKGHVMSLTNIYWGVDRNGKLTKACKACSRERYLSKKQAHGK